MNLRTSLVAFMIFGLLIVLIAPIVYACSAKGPQDPYTGLITYPPGKGPSELKDSTGNDQKTTVPSGLDDTPFKGGKFYKAWSGNKMNLLVVPVGTTLTFEGVIESATKIEPARPDDWEEGEVADPKKYGTTVDSAPRPTWTIYGNGGGDYRGGTQPPLPTDVVLKPFEREADCMIVDDTPAPKAEWKLSYDQNVACNILRQMYDDPVYGTAFKAKLPSDFDIDTLLKSPGEPQIHHDAINYKELTLSAVNCGSVDALKTELRNKLPHAVGETNCSEPKPWEYKDTGPGNQLISVTKSKTVRKTIQAGYIAMQEWYPSGKYSTKYFISRPSCEPYEHGASKLAITFDTPTVPDYWLLDLNSGLESCKDCVWCWIEAEFELKPEGTLISSETVRTHPEACYNETPKDGSYAIGGVMVRGYYQSGNSTAGRNTQAYVVVVDTKAPATFKWLSGETLARSGGVACEAGKTLKESTQIDQDPSGGLLKSLKFRVFDNNPLIGATKFNNINTVFPDLNDFNFIESSLKPKYNAEQVADVPEIYTRYIEPNKDGFNDKNLKIKLVYNVCVPSCLGLKLTEGNAGDLPIPSLFGKIVVPAQRFIWKEIEAMSENIIAKTLYSADGNIVTDLKDLVDDLKWTGYSSFDVEIPFEKIQEPMGYNFAENCRRYDFPYNGETAGAKYKFAPPSVIPTDGTPAYSDKIQFYPWSDNAVKIFPIAQDGSGNQTPGLASYALILKSKLSGVDNIAPRSTKFRDTDSNKLAQDYVATWKDPDDLDGEVKESVPVGGGNLGQSCKLPGGLDCPIEWGKFTHVTSVLDKGKPNIALEILNTKNNKLTIYGNFMAFARSPQYWQAMEKTGTGECTVATETNVGETVYTAKDANDLDAVWEFKDQINNDIYLEFQENLEADRFRPWLFALLKDANLGKDVPIWGANYWNGKVLYNNERVGYNVDSKVRLVFRYWTWDNVNGFDWQNDNLPNGIAIVKNSSHKVVSVNPDPNKKRVTAEITLIDRPRFPGSGNVESSLFDSALAENRLGYIFSNPSISNTNSYEECSLTLKCSDDPNTVGTSQRQPNERTLKVYFKILSPSMETIRTLEEKRERR